MRLLSVSDSFFANREGKYAQGAFLVLLTEDTGSRIEGPCIPVTWKSNKSKRVAVSTYKAETLAMVAGVEQAQYIQESFLDINEPNMTPRMMLCTKSDEFLPLDVVTDCRDLEEGLLAPVQRTTDQSMAIYIYSSFET